MVAVGVGGGGGDDASDETCLLKFVSTKGRAKEKNKLENLPVFPAFTKKAPEHLKSLM